MMASSGKPFPIMVNDYELFEEDMSQTEYEYFQKHIQAFRSMWHEKSVDDKVEFVDEFFKFSEEFGYIRDFPLKMDSKRKFFDMSKEFLIDQFAKAKYSVAKNLVPQIATIASNREKIFQHGSLARGKDPFYNIETRDTFRTFFGEPGHVDTFKKAVANMPLYTRFGGALCRILRRWVEGIQMTPDLFEAMKNRPSIITHDHQRESQTNRSSTGQTNTKEEPKEPKSNALEEKKPVYGHYLDEKMPFMADSEIKKERKSESCVVETNSEKKEACNENKGGMTDKFKQNSEETGKKLHHCGYCLDIEVKPKMYKKCSLCKGKGTRFYCCKDCQRNDWMDRHRQEHVDKANHKNLGL
ncbi:uncharacterized protein LOC135687329 isoform X2 [Rhopilema esculentum]